MCLSIPSKVVELHPDEQAVTVDTMGVKRKVSSHLLAEPLALDDYVLIHIGFVMNKIDKADAMESLALYKEIVSKLEQQEREA
ncbi:HypC/HybG/HupF family hydrogenase formation chaperone [Shewanella fidelis]|uniref:HypC/HybG/HupF family hydrogenase formation chaperone n=1 Tax=Shewanella fidelis TaxID=173509 RepID=A0AAW8NMJ6_9GAMM|nr:HypC/HybG/HupF family hydrogenase formation chaperone [Shewanella fidelis]MDR8523932.1 HypC/HybG/HupF family hydrogenase formation chaperone [Shewanella fidelis]MDW4810479.1 HypC/HybG/HupF family hydrogenase formation chaperone [Shewanella fidelis]MDW4814600.1 HypC/HybG/HupF family hydrogenase formation chaperone [Shewanella fidelis]MDW4818690.1 HypC/HybG/HupF family hydrogenase formation chaperone [Shewanella fidelis]MDW4823633.1 HypC/HybG/HupF family hydrogenase formation chaperone [Shewa